jgi:predicted nucleotidyltransferase
MNNIANTVRTEYGPISPEDRQVLSELRDQLLDRLADRVRRIVVFGSRARGNAHPDSDLDVLVVLSESRPAILEQARSVRYDVMERRQFRPLISMLLLGERDWQDLSTHSAGLKVNIEREGLTLWPTT